MGRRVSGTVRGLATSPFLIVTHTSTMGLVSPSTTIYTACSNPIVPVGRRKIRLLTSSQSKNINCRWTKEINNYTVAGQIDTIIVEGSDSNTKLSLDSFLPFFFHATIWSSKSFFS